MKLKKRNRNVNTFPVLIGIPVPKLDHKLNSSLATFLNGCACRRIGLSYMMSSNLAEYARNNIIDAFLHDPDYKNFTHLLFMDHDTSPVDPFMVERLLEHKKDVVAGITPILFLQGERPSFQWNVKIDDKGTQLNKLPTELFEAQKVGGTSILIKRNVLEKLEKPYQRSTFDDNHVNFKQSEDYYFCDQIRKAGFKIWIDPTQMCRHWHTVDLMQMVDMMARIKEAN